MNATTADLERQVEEARGRLGRTTRVLKDRRQPQELLDEATTMMTETRDKMMSTAVEQLRENPIPIALIGLGVAWLALGRTSRRDPYDPMHESVADRVKARAEAARTKLSARAEAAKARLADAQSQAGEGLSEARRKASDYAHMAQEKAQDYGRAARARFDETLDHEPLVIGAIGVAVGAAIGASLPATEAERRYIGPVRAKAAEKAKESIDEAKTVAGRAYGQVKDDLRRQIAPDETPAAH
jgi:ElaB/YqjD/DUF883 family membrane-anchored ribosome-binding protein